MDNVNNELNSDLSNTSLTRSNYSRIMESNNDFDSSSDENVVNLAVERRRNRISRVNNKISLEKKETLIKLYEEGKIIAEAAQISDDYGRLCASPRQPTFFRGLHFDLENHKQIYVK
ncbi:PREDICTED: uncharacterized protein LOC107063645 [Polistes dominula]|uniref:Uncharacterized protein LOC107063645 n=1 Tax=Polistes dominula TaxID=743375 RepID=A0ABM1HSW6_POLDO|nr:PREDICTED: uncharacterized protein LOC107063645 [Polistes dominula]